MKSTEFFSGQGDDSFIELLNNSYAHFVPTAAIPNISMLISPYRDALTEGFYWNGFWIQNSYGFVFNSVPFLTEPFFTLMQNSLDLHWDRMGDGVRMGYDPEHYEAADELDPLFTMVAPDGCLGDTVMGPGIIYKQGDHDFINHDWFYEGTAAGILMQAEMLLRKRDIAEIKKYLPKMMRSCNFIEKTRDDNGLFLVGKGCNLLAPSFGAAVNDKGEIEKSYLAGLTITYTGALMRMIELCRLVSGTDLLAICEERLKMNTESMPLIKTDEGYFVKSVEKNGIKHGVYGAEKFGYFESVSNVDAIATGAADEETAQNIYKKIASISKMLPTGFLPTNYPGLDDMYMKYGTSDLSDLPDVFLHSGSWVNGGVWGTIEGRTVLAYFKLDKIEDAVRSAGIAYEWTKNYRMDAPWSQWGANTYNYWSDCDGRPEVSVMIDNFAVPAAVLRGVFDYEYSADMLKLTPHLPASLKEVKQNRPIYWGGKEIYISCSGGEKITGVTVNGQGIDTFDNKSVYLNFDSLPQTAIVAIGADGANPDSADVFTRAQRLPDISFDNPEINEKYRQVKSFLEKEPDREAAGGRLAVECAQALYERIHTEFDASNETLRPMTDVKKTQIIDLYEQAFLRAANRYLDAFKYAMR